MLLHHSHGQVSPVHVEETNTTRSCWTETHKPKRSRRPVRILSPFGATVRVDASLTAIIVLVVIVLVVVVYRECKANWYRDISQWLPPLSADCALAVVYLWPGYYRRPATQDLEVGVPGTPCRAAVPLRYAKQAEDLSSPSAIPREPARSGTREKFSRTLVRF